MTVHTVIPLNLLPPGRSARIDQLVGQPDETHRLEELGLRPGTVIEMVQSGSPCIIRVSGQKLCFRDCDVFKILVSPGDAA